MLERYFIIADKDAHGFIVPWSSIDNKPPELYNTKEEAQENLDYYIASFKGMLEQKPTPLSFFDRVRGASQVPRIPDDTKNKMRNFILNAIVREVVLKL